MEKRNKYQSFHRQLAKQYNTNPSVIRSIRSFYYAEIKNEVDPGIFSLDIFTNDMIRYSKEKRDMHLKTLQELRHNFIFDLLRPIDTMQNAEKRVQKLEGRLPLITTIMVKLSFQKDIIYFLQHTKTETLQEMLDIKLTSN